MKRLLFCGLVALGSASYAPAAVIEVLNDAKGTYTYSAAPTSGSDSGKTSVSFDRTGTNWSDVGSLVDDKAMYSISALIREFPEAAGIDGGSMAYFPGNIHGGLLTITFELDSLMTATGFFVQVATANEFDALPSSVTYSISNDGSNWNQLGAVLLANSVTTSDPRETYYLLNLDASIATKWVKIDAVSSTGHNLRISEVELRYDDAVPEPAGAALLGMVELPLLRRRRK